MPGVWRPARLDRVGLVAGLALMVGGEARANDNGVARARAGCELCHNSAPRNDPALTVNQISGRGSSRPGELDTYVVRVSGGHENRGGFSIWASEGTLSRNLDSPSATRTIVEVNRQGDDYEELTHSRPGVAQGGVVEWWVDWTPPEEGVDEAELWVSAISANGNGRRQGDYPLHIEISVPIRCSDEDGDQHADIACGGDDCNDDDINIHPNAEERCNDLDDDCDQEVDEDFDFEPCPLVFGVCGGARPFCRDNELVGCDEGAYGDDYEAQELSCDGLDNDCDRLVDEDVIAPDGACPVLGVCVDAEADCRGADGWVCEFPRDHEEVETLCDALDNDCDGETDEGAIPPPDLCPPLGVCADGARLCEGEQGWRCELPPEHARVETTCDGLDNDCDGEVDEGGVPPPGLCPAFGVCANALPVCAGVDGWACDFPDEHEPEETTCDALDNDCDGLADEDLVPPDEVCPNEGLCVDAFERCQGQAGWECVFPRAYEPVELTCNGLDDDCDGLVDEELDGPPGLCSAVGVCAGGVPRCGGVDGWACELPDTHEPRELSCDGLDNDCDGEVDEGVRPPPEVCPVFGVCADAVVECRGEDGWACAFPPEHEEEEVSCDGLDNDCDRFTDPDCVCEPGVGTRACGSDDGECGAGVQHCPDGRWAEECVGEVGPHPEQCNGADDDCDGATDEDLPPPEEPCPSEGVCAAARAECAGGRWVCLFPPEHEPDGEVTCDGLDNDCDGETDENQEPPPGLCPDQGVCADAEPACDDAGWQCELPEAHEDGDEVTCDGLDNDCDGEIDEALTAPDGACLVDGVCAGALAACIGGAWRCDYPETREADGETSCDGLDNDCDGETDEELEDHAPVECLSAGVCAGTRPTCGGETLWSCPYPDEHRELEGAADCDGLDNDCDGITDPGCGCVDGEQRPCGEDVGACTSSTQTCDGDAWSEGCEGAVGPSDELCDGLDNDCDGRVDEGCECQPEWTRECPNPTPGCPAGMQACGGDHKWGACALPDCGSDAGVAADAGTPPASDGDGGGGDDGLCTTTLPAAGPPTALRTWQALLLPRRR
jgi:hypothetical protein